MNNYSISEIFEEAYNREFTELDNLPKHRFSISHKRKMKKIFKLYNRNLKQQASVCLKPARRLSFVAIIIAALAVLAVSAAAVAIYNGFLRKEYKDHTDLFPINYENAPETIDYIYKLTALPTGYEKTDEVLFNTIYHIVWKNEETGTTISFDQSVKSKFNSHYDNEHGDFETVYIEENPLLYIDWSSEYNDYGVIVWDNGDYILEIIGNLTKDKLLNLAKSAEIEENSKN